MHAIIADKARPAAIPEDHALAGGKDAQSKKDLAKDSSDEIIKTEESQKTKSLMDIAFASKFVGQMSRTRNSEDEEGDGGQK